MKVYPDSILFINFYWFLCPDITVTSLDFEILTNGDLVSCLNAVRCIFLS